MVGAIQSVDGGAGGIPSVCRPGGGRGTRRRGDEVRRGTFCWTTSRSEQLTERQTRPQLWTWWQAKIYPMRFWRRTRRWAGTFEDRIDMVSNHNLH